MSDHISREALKEAFDNADADVCESYSDGYCDWGFGRKNINDVIDGVPAADVEPVRHGRWEPGNPICPVCGEDKFKGLDADIWSDWTPACCPNCGAKMDLEGNDGNRPSK